MCTVEDVIGRQVVCTVKRLLLGGRSCALCRGCYWEASRVHCVEAVIGRQVVCTVERLLLDIWEFRHQ